MSERPVPRVVLLWTNYGPYHFARARALMSLVDLYAIEYAGSQGLYGWDGTPPAGLRFETLDASVYERAHRGANVRALLRRLSAIRPDAILIPGYREPTSVAAALWGRTHRATNVLMSDSNYCDYPRKSWLEYGKHCCVRALFDGAIVAGSRSEAYVTTLGLRPERVRRYYDVVDNEHFRQGVAEVSRTTTRLTWGLPNRYFLYVGRLAPEKNISGLISAYSVYRQAGGDFSLVVVGDGPLARELRAQAATTPWLEDIRFVTRKGYRDILPYYAFADWLVLPSVRDQWGLVVNEAMACGVPVLVSRACGCSDDLVRHGSTGFVFDPYSEAELAHVLSMCAQMNDRGRSGMSEQCLRRISEFTLDRWAAAVLDLISGEQLNRATAEADGLEESDPFCLGVASKPN